MRNRSPIRRRPGTAPVVGIFALPCALVLLLCLAPNPALAFPAPPDSSRAAASDRPALWLKAVEIFETNKRLVPGTARQRIEELDKEGAVKSVMTVDLALAPDSSRGVATTIVRAAKDGKDITAEERRKAAEREAKEAKKEAKEKASKKQADAGEESHSFSSGDGPFNAKTQPELRVSPSGARETVDGASCARFAFSYPERRESRTSGKPVTVTGTAWIEEISGRPIRVEYTFDPLPKRVKHMRTVLRYGAEGSGAWILREMAFEARGSFLFIGKSMRGTISFGDYWKYEGPDSL